MKQNYSAIEVSLANNRKRLQQGREDRYSRQISKLTLGTLSPSIASRTALFCSKDVREHSQV